MKSVKQQIHECVTEQLLEEVLKLKERVEKHRQDVYSPVNSLLTRQLQALTSQCNTLLGHLPTYPDCGLDKDHPSYMSYILDEEGFDAKYRDGASITQQISENSLRQIPVCDPSEKMDSQKIDEADNIHRKITRHDIISDLGGVLLTEYLQRKKEQGSNKQ